MDRQQELQQNILWLREKLEPMDEPELPLVLSGEILKQRAQTLPKARVSPWRKMLPLACTIVLAVAVGLWGGFATGKTADTAVEENLAAVPQMALYSAEESAAYSADEVEMASSLLRAAEYSVEVKTHIVNSDSKKVLKELYPGIQFYSLTLVGDFWTVIHITGIEGEAAVAVRSDEAEVLDEEQCYVVRELESGKELRFDSTTLKKVK